MQALAPPTTLIMADKAGPVETFLLRRGRVGAYGEALEPGTPAALHLLDWNLPRNRLGMVKGITSPANPLTA